MILHFAATGDVQSAIQTFQQLQEQGFLRPDNLPTSPLFEKDTRGRNALYYALCNGHWNFCEWFSQFVDTNSAVDVSGTPYLHQFSLEGRPEAVRWLLVHGAKVDLLDELGSTPLHIASYSGNADVVQVLLSHGAKPNLKCSYGYVPLHYAAARNHGPTVQLLIEFGADVTQVSNGGTPLDFAANAAIKAELEASAVANLIGSWSLN